MNLPVRNENASDTFEFSILRSYDNNRLQEFVEINLPKLVNDQKYAYRNRNESSRKNAPGGTGKSFLINLLLAQIRSSSKIVLAAASSGIAATLLSGGRTAHSTFKLPLNVLFDTEYVCPIRKNGPLGKIFQETSFVLWDDCTMSHRSHIEAIDRTLKDLRCNNKFMGGIAFIFAVYLCGGDDIFPAQLLKIGNGTLENENGYISVNHTIGRVVNNVEELIYTVHPDIFNLSNKSYQWLCERAIISPRNVTAVEINDIILLKFDGHSREYLSIDTVTSTDDGIHYPQEFFNSLSPSGFPPHKLKLKIGALITLLRYLQPLNLCNGTRLQIKSLRNNIIEAGHLKEKLHFSKNYSMIPSDLPFSFKRLQFPVKVSFAITINKAQGQTFKYVVVDLRTECFSHGQLYVAFSRTGDPNHLDFNFNRKYNKKHHNILRSFIKFLF
ncbi:ATP-dependent DNA helicase PIF1-like [Aphis craccivora]|uniref:ATP-dependent DNA helicase n=1 Tax=Aphis craccivora TaxID=307492 RepID=A0A6G0VZA5_APHCR|nr:ATP-dependent DNA helicase PIF1-like [Aphis craccivora]